MKSFDEKIKERFSEVIRSREDMHKYQCQGVTFLIENPFSALFLDLGMGKCIITLTAITDLLSEFAFEKALVIGPLRVATETWPTEISEWEHTAGFNYSLIHVKEDDPRVDEIVRKARKRGSLDGLRGSDLNKYVGRCEHEGRLKLRSDAAKSSASIHIISRDWIEWLVNFHGPKWPYKCVIIDESSGFKDHKSKRFKALKKVVNTKGLITRLHELTATPAAETYENLFSQIFLLDGGERFGKTITGFRDEYFTFNRYSYKYKLKPGVEEQILKKISDITLVMKSEDYLSLEKPKFISRVFELSEKQKKLYNTMVEDFIVTLDDGSEVEAETSAALSQKLLQMASGVLYETVSTICNTTGDLLKKTKVHPLHDHKIEELKNIVEEAQGENILVGYHFKSSLDRLKKAFPSAVVMDRDGSCVKPWNNKKIPMLLMHPQSGGHGLNLQHGGHIMVFFDIPWSLELFLQFIGRLARQGQKKPVLVYLLIAKNTIDEIVYAALQAKEDVQEKLFIMLKKAIRSYHRHKKIINVDIL